MSDPPAGRRAVDPGLVQATVTAVVRRPRALISAGAGTGTGGTDTRQGDSEETGRYLETRI